MVLTRKRSGRNDRGLTARDVKTYSDSGIANALDVPNLIRSQIESFDWFKTNGLAETFRDCSPIVAGITRRFASGDGSRRAERFELYFLDHWFDTEDDCDLCKITGECNVHPSPETCREREITYSRPLYVKAQLRDQETGEITESDIFFGDVPMMTRTGTFIINGAERVLVSQLQRAPGVYYEREPSQDPACPECGKLENWYYKGRISASRGARIEMQTWTHYYARRRNLPETITVSVDRRRRMGVSTFLHALGIVSAEEMRALFSDIDFHDCRSFVGGVEPAPDRDYNPREEELRSLWDRMHPDRDFNREQAFRIGLAQRNLYKWLRPGEPAVQVDAACTFVVNHFFDGRRFDLGEVGRIKVDQRLGRSNSQVLTESQKAILEFVRAQHLERSKKREQEPADKKETETGVAVNEIFVASSREQRILAERDVDALITYGYLVRGADRRIEPLDPFADASDETVAVNVSCADAASAGTLLSSVDERLEGCVPVSVQGLVTDTLGDPVAISTQQIPAGATSNEAISSGETSS